MSDIDEASSNLNTQSGSSSETAPYSILHIISAATSLIQVIMIYSKVCVLPQSFPV